MKIVLCCSAGMSTSLVVSKMKKIAPPETDISAMGMEALSTDAKDADVILIGPQMGYNKPKVVELFPDKPVEIIPMRMYGMADGEGVYKLALELVKK